MAGGTLYQWLSFENRKYVKKDINPSYHYDISISEAEDFRSIGPFFPVTHSHVIIPELNSKLLIELLQHAGISNIERFITIGCMFQHTYNDNYELDKDDLLSDFNLEQEAYITLLDLLEKYLFSESKNDLHSIAFKFNRSPSLSIKNFLVVDDIYKAICIGYGLTKNNFYRRKTQIISKTNPFKVDKYDELVKTNFIQKLYTKIYPLYNKESNTLRFVGLFCNIFEIPTNSNFPEIEIHENLEDSLNSVDFKNLKHYISRPPKIRH